MNIPYKRKREGKTNYKKRLELLKSRKDRLVIRRSNKHLLLQVVRYHVDGDHVLVGVSSKKLTDLGWQHSTKNIPSAYLAGLLLAKAAKEKKIKEIILDIGLQTPIKGSRIYAALKGVVDGGMKVPAGDDIYPSEDRLSGKHISEQVAKSFVSLKQKLTGTTS